MRYVFNLLMLTSHLLFILCILTVTSTFFQNLSELETNLYSCLCNAVRAGYNVSRLSDYCQERFHIELGIMKKVVGHVFEVDMGGQTTISGYWGNL